MIPTDDIMSSASTASRSHAVETRAADTRRIPISWLLIALILGVAHAFSFAPLGNGYMQIAVLTAFLGLLGAAIDRRASGARLTLLGLLFGIGWFSAGVGWLHVAMHDFGGMPWALAALAVLLFATYLGLYPALAAWLTGRLHTSRHSTAFVLSMAGAFTLAELGRGHVLTGFPWLGIGYAQVDTPLAGFAPLGGVYAVTLVTLLVAASLAILILRRHWLWLLLPALLFSAGSMLRCCFWSEPAGQPISVSLLQGNIPQQMKFDPVAAAQARQEYLDMIEANPADLVLLPETAWTVPWQGTEDRTRQRIQAFVEKTGSAIALGSPRITRNPNPPANDPYQGMQFSNSMVLLDKDSLAGRREPPIYDKQHLVPFGEFVPPGARWFVDMMNIPLGELHRGAADQPPAPIRDQRIGFNICYEDIFGEELLPALQARDGQHEGATILANLTNLGWYGRSYALPQHLQIARMRAMETARPMIRATNNGVTAIIDADGSIVNQLPYHERATLHAQVQGRTGLTPYAAVGGNLPIWLLSALMLLIGLAWRPRR